MKNFREICYFPCSFHPLFNRSNFIEKYPGYLRSFVADDYKHIEGNSSLEKSHSLSQISIKKNLPFKRITGHFPQSLSEVNRESHCTVGITASNFWFIFSYLRNSDR